MGNAIKSAAAFLALCCLYAGPADCKTYKCKDAEGITLFSDTACNAVPREELNPHADKATATLDQDAIKSCLAYLKSSQQFPDPDSVKVADSRSIWVAVKGVGSRRMLHLDVLSKNQYGVYAGATDMHCLMMGDGRTVSTYPYELLDKQ
jgi:hypothetical protein